MSKSMIVLLLLVPLFTQATSFQVSAQENSNEATDEEARYAAEEAKYAAEEARKKKEGKAAADAIELLGATIWSRVYLPDTITDDALVHAGKLIYIEGLTCNSEEITDKGLKYLAGLDVIYNIDLTDCSSITGSGFVHWEDNKINLRKLLLRRTKVDDAGLASLRANLNILDLGETKITDAGLKHLKNLISDEDKRDGIRLNLDELFLDGTQITDDGLVHLNPGGEDPEFSLTRLHLANTGVTDAGLVHLEKLYSIEFLDLANTAVTTEGVKGFHQARLQKEFPKCLINLDYEQSDHR